MAQPVSHDATIASQQRLLRWNSLPSRPPQLRPQLGAAQGSQAAISQPQLGAAQGSQAAISQPQVGAAHAPAHPESQQARRLPSFPRLHLALPNSSINGRRRGLQPTSHALPHGSQLAISQPQLGAAPQPPSQAGAAISQPQLGAALQPLSQAGAAISQPQLGAEAQPLSQIRPLRRLSNPPPQAGAQASAQPTSQLGAISHPQLGAAEQPVSQQALSQPAPRIPSMRSSRPPPKLGVHRLAPSTRDPIKIFTFIEPQLPKR